MRLGLALRAVIEMHDIAHVQKPRLHNLVQSVALVRCLQGFVFLRQFQIREVVKHLALGVHILFDMLNLHIDLLHRSPFLKVTRGIVYRQRDNRVFFQNLLDKTVHMDLLDFQIGFKKLRELLLLSDFGDAKPRNLVLCLAIHHCVFPYHTRSPNQTFRQQDGIVAEEKFEVVNNNLLDLFFGPKPNLRIECANENEQHEKNFIKNYQGNTSL